MEGWNIVNLISAASVDFDNTAAGEARRCALLADDGELVCDSCWHSGPRLTEQLTNLSQSATVPHSARRRAESRNPATTNLLGFV